MCCNWWLLDNPEEVSRILDDVRMTIDFLQQKEIIHFDAHFRNFLTDGEHIYLTDFGLLLDKSCLRDENEQDFFNRHTYYDYGSAVSCLSDLIFDIFEALPEDAQQQLKNTYGAVRAEQKAEHVEDYNFGRLMFTLYENIEEIHASGILPVNENLLEYMNKYRGISILMDNFYLELIPNNQKDTQFPNEELARLLHEAEFFAGADR